MTDPRAAAATPPADLNARYVPFSPVSAWLEASPELQLFDDAAAELQRLTGVVGPERADRALEVARRAAAFDTGAIEGLYSTDRGVTFSVAEQAAGWEALAAREAGRDAVRHFQAQLAAFDLVLDAVTGATVITSAWLRALHEAICGGQDTYRALTAVGWQELPLPKGEFKNLPNHVREPDGSWHSYAPPDQTPSEMQRLVDELASPGFARAHPVVQAAFAHHALVAVHPFVDGNGRVARALGSVFLYRAARVPLHIWADQRLRYFDTLRAADRGDRVVFTRFVRDVTVDTIRLVVLRLRPAARRATPAAAGRRRVVSTPISDEADDALLARRVLTAVAELAGARVAHGTVEQVDVDDATPLPPVPAGLEARPVAARPGALRVAAGEPGRTALVTVVGAAAPDSPSDLALVGDRMPALSLRRDQLDPAVTEVTAAQLAAWVDDLVDQLTAD